MKQCSSLKKGKAKMMNDKKKQKVYEILMMPIECTGYSNGKPIIKIENEVIKTTQTYYPYKEWDIPLDPDMSDFAVGFYEIIYRDLLEEVILDSKDALSNKDYAGDTMNSFNTIANSVAEAGSKKDKREPMEKWPKWLQKYEAYHRCLANFWVIPMEMGRTVNNEWCKGSYDKDVRDYMDRFLNLYKANLEQYKMMYPSYFENINSFKDFVRLHILFGSYVSDNDNMEVYSFSNDEHDRKTVVDKIQDNIKLRAKAISESKYANELWEYFLKNGLLGYKETYLEPDEYPLNKKVHPYAYECPKCNRIIINDENYSIPPVCDECSKRD